ncbi:hypothetical protein [Micromonospora sp. NPDC004704]
MSVFRLDLYAPGDRLTGVRLITAPTGIAAAETARKAVWTTGSDRADVYWLSTASGDWYYDTVRAAR